MAGAPLDQLLPLLDAQRIVELPQHGDAHKDVVDCESSRTASRMCESSCAKTATSSLGDVRRRGAGTPRRTALEWQAGRRTLWVYPRRIGFSGTKLTSKSGKFRFSTIVDNRALSPSTEEELKVHSVLVLHAVIFGDRRCRARNSPPNDSSIPPTADAGGKGEAPPKITSRPTPVIRPANSRASGRTWLASVSMIACRRCLLQPVPSTRPLALGGSWPWMLAFRREQRQP